MIELDHNATTKPTPSAVAAVVDALEQRWHNPSSVHRAGQAARAQVELARADIAKLLCVSPRQLVFTSCGTESINLAVRGWLAAASPGTKPILLTSRVEHAAVRDLAEDLARDAAQSPGAGCEVRWLAIDSNGVVDVAALERELGDAGSSQPRPCLVAAQWANNETGAIQPVDAIHAACKAHRATFLCDATQWVGKMPLAQEPPCDLLVCSAHKFHGPKGVGILWSSPRARWRPRQLGTQELGRRGGTENVPGIAGAAAAARDAMQWLEQSAARDQLASWRNAFERDIIARVNAILPAQWPRAVVNAAGAPRLWNTTNIAFPRLEAEAILLALSERGVNASAGAACSSGSLDPSPVLLAMGIDPELAHGSVRFSMSRHTTREELARAGDIVVEVVTRLVASMPG